MGKSAPRFLIRSKRIGPEEALIEGAQARHARTVLRLQVGDTLVVFDGTGWQYQARITMFEKQGVRVALEKPLAVKTESSLDLALAQGFLKDKKMDMLVRHLTELGVQRWIPFMAERSIPAPSPQRLQARSLRWQKISQEAAKQCRRIRPMKIEPAVSFEAALTLAGPYDLKLIFWEKEASCLSPNKHDTAMPGRIFAKAGIKKVFLKYGKNLYQLL